MVVEGERLGRLVGKLAPQVEQQKMEQNFFLLRLQQIEQLEQNFSLLNWWVLLLVNFWLGS